MLLAVALLLLTGCDFMQKILVRRVAYTIWQINGTSDTLYHNSRIDRSNEPFTAGPILLPIPPGDSTAQQVLDHTEMWPTNYGKPSLYDTVLSYTIAELKAMNYRVVYRGKPVTP